MGVFEMCWPAEGEGKLESDLYCVCMLLDFSFSRVPWGLRSKACLAYHRLPSHKTGATPLPH